MPGPFDPQALNRYSYVRNNPVILTDPSGHFFVSIISTALGAAMVASQPWVAMTIASGISTDWDIGAMALHQGIALTAAYTGGATAGALGGGFLATLAGGAVAAATSTALYDLAGYDVNYGQSILTGLAISAVTFGVGEMVAKPFVYQMATGFIASGIAAEMNGGDFSNSLLTGFSVSAAGFLGSVMASRLTGPTRLGETADRRNVVKTDGMTQEQINRITPDTNRLETGSDAHVGGEFLDNESTCSGSSGCTNSQTKEFQYIPKVKGGFNIGHGPIKNSSGVETPWVDINVDTYWDNKNNFRGYGIEFKKDAIPGGPNLPKNPQR